MLRRPFVLVLPRWILATAGVLLLSLDASAALISVTSTSGDVGGPECTLRDAIAAANLDLATGGCDAGSGTDTIRLGEGATYPLTAIDNSTDGDNGLPSVVSDITIQGRGSVIEGDGASFRIFHVAVGGSLMLQDLEVRAGRIVGATGTSDSTRGEDGRGGCLWNQGSLTILRSIVNDCVAIGGAGAPGDGQPSEAWAPGNGGDGLGGGLYNGSILLIQDTKIAGNRCEGGSGADEVDWTGPGLGGDAYGGGLFNEGTAEIERSTLQGNLALGPDGRGLSDPLNGFSHEGRPARGGGIGHLGGTLSLSETTLSGNEATGGVGGTDEFFGSAQGGAGSGGGIFWNGDGTISSSTITFNTATGGAGGTGADAGVGSGGGIFVDSSAMVDVGNTILAGNTATTTAPSCHSIGMLTSLDYNLMDSECFAGSFASSDLDLGVLAEGITEVLEPLADNGGFVNTHALKDGSPAIDAGSCGGLGGVDARGLGRPQDLAATANADDGCDIGAYELLNPNIFSDGFESGNTFFWAEVVPAP